MLAEFPVFRQQGRLKSLKAVRVFRVTTVKETLWQLQHNRPTVRNWTSGARRRAILRMRCGRRIVGQDEAVEALVELYQVFCAGLRSPGRPVGNLLFLGPTGSGKTHWP